MTDTNYVIHITQGKLEQLVGEDTGSIRKPKQRMIREDCPQSHCPRMQDGFVAETAQACMAMHDLNLFSNNNVPEDWKE